jgi:alginate O-acetyltransferase complex protein AlgI
LIFTHTSNVWFATPPLLVGLSLVLHFGLFGLICAGWRRAGFDLRPLFRAPLLATSLADFWKRRWNVAFSEMCQEGVARALSPLGPRMVAVSIFVFSGLLHEAAISLPVNAGYGGPMAYFAIHGCAAQIEPKLFRPGSVASRLWTALLVLAPLPLLFHQPFLQGCVWPLIGAAP